MDNLSVLANLLISIGCQNADLTYKQACFSGLNQTVNYSGVNDKLKGTEREIGASAEDLVRIYIFPYTGQRFLGFIVTGGDILTKKEVVYSAPVSDNKIVVFRAKENSTSISLNWRFK